MITHTQLAILVAIVLVLRVAGLSFEWIVSILLALVLIFNFFLWPSVIFRGWLVKRPMLRGTWRAELRSDWVDPATGRQIPPIKGFMKIRQTYSRLGLQLYTEESSSQIIGVELRCDDDGCFNIVGVYRNEPRYSVRQGDAAHSGVRPGSTIHFGALELKVLGEPAHALKGHYWTDRKTAGEIHLTDRHQKLIDDFETAQRKLG